MSVTKEFYKIKGYLSVSLVSKGNSYIYIIFSLSFEKEIMFYKDRIFLIDGDSSIHVSYQIILYYSRSLLDV